MGIFSSKYETRVATSVSRVIEDKALPNSIKRGGMKGLFTDDGEQMINYTLEELTTSIGLRAHRMYNYGEKTYEFGLPASSLHTNRDGQPQVKSILDVRAGQPVTFDYYHVGPLNNLHLGWRMLDFEQGYDSATNQLGNLTAAKGTPVYLVDMIVVVKDSTLAELANGSLDQWGTPPNVGVTADRLASPLRKASPFEVDSAAANDYLRVHYNWLEAGVVKTGAFVMPVTGVDEQADWFQVKYAYAGRSHYFLYEAGAGTYPVLDKLNNPDFAGNGSYFPWTYFRYNKVSGMANPDGDEHKQSKKLMKYIGIDYDQMCDAIHENPDIAQVEQAIMMMAVPALSDNQMDQRYAFDFFDALYANYDGSTKPGEQGAGILGLLNTFTSAASIVIQDKRFKMALGFQGIYKKTVVGNVGTLGRRLKIGTYASGFGTAVNTEAGENTQTGAPVVWSTDVKSHFYQKQITDDMYEELRVVDLKMTYYIYEQYTTTGDELDNILMLPIDRSIAQYYSVPDRELLYARSLHLVFNSRVVTEIKWYQRNGFKYILLIAAIIIAAYTGDYELVISAWALGTLTAEAILYMVAIGILKYVAVQIAMRLFVKAFGAKFAFFVAIVAAIAGVYQSYTASAVQGAPWASQLLQLSTNLAKAVSVDLKDKFKELEAEAKTFGIEVEAKKKKLEEAQNLLEHNNWLTPEIIFGESPNDFYQRTVHSGNIGVLSLDAISSYVDISLTLPKLTDTL